jgi:hypothetical protein
VGDGFQYYAPGNSIAVDSSGRAYLAGTSSGVDCQGGSIPITPNAFQSSYADCRAAFLGVLDPSQTGPASLVYGSYLGGSNPDSNGENGDGVAVDGYGMAYVAGTTYSRDFPVTPGAFQVTFGGGESDAFLAKFNPYASSGPASVLYSTYLGGGGGDYGYTVAVDAIGNAVISGATTSGKQLPSFPTTPGALQPNWNGSWGDYSGFVTKMNAAGNNLIFSTYLGGADAEVRGVVVDNFGNASAAGYSAGQLLLTPTGFQQQYEGGSLYGYGQADGFVSQLDPSGNLLYSSYLGGTGYDQAVAIAVDGVGDAYVTGWTTSVDFPTTAPCIPASNQPRW